MSESLGFEFELLRGAISTNETQLSRMVKKVEKAADGLKEKSIAVWGLTFKADTDDRRCSPAVEITKRLIAAGARVQAFDPMVSEVGDDIHGVELFGDMYEVLQGCVVLAVLTEWPEFQDADFSIVRDRLGAGTIVDCRNLLDSNAVRSHNLRYVGIGTP
jgi:UDPglucose 6-dehydrogenase